MKKNKTLKSFAVQNTIIAVIAIILTCVILGFFSFAKIEYYHSRMSENKLISAAVSVSETVAGDILENLQPGGNDTPQYQKLHTTYKNISDKLEFEYIYILKKTGVPGEYMFILDTDPETQIGEIYEVDDDMIKYMEQAFSGKACISAIYEDEWGVFMSGYAPVYDNAGKVTAIVGADLNALEFRQSISGELVSYIIRCLIITVLILAVFTATTFIGYLQIKSALVFVITKLRDYSKSIFKSVNIFNDRSTLLSQKAAGAAGSISGMFMVLEKISSEIKMTDENMQKAADYFTVVSGELNAGSKNIGNLSESIKDIENSGNEITNVIDIINSIAKKTKILAINAEVEAARVGETGKSFAVVAQEVGTLAQSVENAAKNTGSIIEKNKNYIKRAVENTEGVEKTIVSIEKEINELNVIISQVSGASSEQTKNIGKMRGDMSEIKNAASENASSAEDMSSSTQELSSMTDNLDEHVDKIKKTISNNLKF